MGEPPSAVNRHPRTIHPSSLSTPISTLLATNSNNMHSQHLKYIKYISQIQLLTPSAPPRPPSHLILPDPAQPTCHARHPRLIYPYHTHIRDGPGDSVTRARTHARILTHRNRTAGIQVIQGCNCATKRKDREPVRPSNPVNPENADPFPEHTLWR